jgi:hypothetical protein
MELLKHVGKNGSEIFLNPKGWIEVVWGTLIDKEEYIDIGQRMYDLVTAMGDAGDPPLMLIDFSRMDDITAEAAAFAATATKDLGCDKIAGFGIKPQFKGALDVIKARSTKADTIREFDGREEAEAWLLA